jgi:hypothetical protein
VAADLGPVEVGLKMYEVGHAIAAIQGVGDDVGHEPGVKSGLLESPLQALALRTVVMEAVVVRGLACGGGRQGLGCWRLGAHSLHFHRSAGDLLTAGLWTRAAAREVGP